MDKSSTPNFIVIVSDTLRTAYLGCYGNRTIQTPNIDALALQSVQYLRAYPESLPTIPVRRALHSGRRAFPFAEYRPIPWDHVYLPGWQPMSPEEPTLAETLAQRGYQTGFYSDCPHYFVPAMNFHRGFHQFQFVRGQSEDQFRSHLAVDQRRMSPYVQTRGPRGVVQHLANVRPELPEEEWPTARTMRAASRFLEENAGRSPLYLYVDTFSPHESWEAPLSYYKMYGELADREPVALSVPYGPLSKSPEFEDRLPSIIANYSGLVSLVDTWVGHLLDTVRRLGLDEDTYLFFTSDHGTNFADNAEQIIGKPATYLYPGTMHVPLLLRKPGAADSGSTENALVYNSIDVPATIAEIAGLDASLPVDGHSLLSAHRNGRTFLTSRYGNTVFYVSDKHYYFAPVDFSSPRLFLLDQDPNCNLNVAAEHPQVLKEIESRITRDAGGDLVSYVRQDATDALGRPVFA